MTNRQAAIKIIKKLREAGFTAMLAGGCVRDTLIKRVAKDYDVATEAKPEQIIKLFKRTLKVGAKFGVIIVLLDDQQVEVATFRAEAGYADGRHPDKVEFSNAQQDSMRRDFTINGMFYDTVKKEVIDYVGGQVDLGKKLIRTIGDPGQRFGEDYLRMLRAVRFATQLKFRIDDKTFAAIKKYAANIKHISSERIAIEFGSVVVDPNRVEGMVKLLESNLLFEIFEDLSESSVNKGIEVLGFLPRDVDFALALAAFFSDYQTNLSLKTIKSLKLSNRCFKHIKFLLENRGTLLDADMSLSQLKLLLSEPYFDDLFVLQTAIQKAESLSVLALNKLRKRIRDLGDVELKPDPLLNGHDLIRLGASSGPQVGHLAKEMYIAQLEGIISDREQAEKWVSKWVSKYKNLR